MIYFFFLSASIVSSLLLLLLLLHHRPSRRWEISISVISEAVLQQFLDSTQQPFTMFGLSLSQSGLPSTHHLSFDFPEEIFPRTNSREAGDTFAMTWSQSIVPHHVASRLSAHETLDRATGAASQTDRGGITRIRTLRAAR